MRPNAKNKSLVYFSVVMLALYLMPVIVMADERPEKMKENDETELRVVIPIGEENAEVTDKDIRSKMLSEKLIKMGRARSQSCTRCHGRTGMAALANAIGWNQSIAEFVVKQLTELREGKRAHAVMSSIAKPLSDQDIALIAAWYQSVSPNDANK